VKTAADKPRPDVSKNLQIARASLQRDDLSTADAKLAAVIAAQPKNRDALSLRDELADRQRQRDVALEVARNCENEGRWTCAWQSAGNALVMDSSSADAKRIVTRSIQQSQTAAAPPAPAENDSQPSHEPPAHH
jgi:predicted Zn-dependent protease